jgi:hypothetical protein
MKSSLAISVSWCVVVAACMIASDAWATEGVDECLRRFAKKHVPEGTLVRVADDAKITAEQLRTQRGESRVTADLVGMPGNRPFGSVTCVLSRRGNLLFMYADVRDPRLAGGDDRY